MKRFLVVIEDIYNNKEHIQTNKIGDTIQEMIDERNLVADFDKEKLNSDDPYQAGGFSMGFYDIDTYEKSDEEDTELEYAGRIFIFDLFEDE